MSWDESGKQERKCPCGKGTYTITFFSDDWNRHEESWVMNCIACTKKYVLHSHTDIDSGLKEESFQWVLAKESAKLNALVKAVEQSKEKAVRIAESRYLRKWLDCMMSAGTKRSVWAKLTDNGKRYPSLAMFYTHTRREPIEAYLKSHFDFEEIPRALIALRVSDAELATLLKTAKGLERKQEEQDAQMRRGGPKGV